MKIDYDDKIEKGKDYYHLKGKNAEEIAYYLAEKTFFSDWCFLNPKIKKGKELCDILVSFEKTLIIISIKNSKLDEDGKYSEKDYEKSLRQLNGAKKSISRLKQFYSKNGGKIQISDIDHIFCISVMFGERGPFLKVSEDYKGTFVNNFDREFLEISLNELNTISDFINYLIKKEQLVNALESNRTFFIGIGGEKNLLAYYLFNNKKFDDLLLNFPQILTIEENSWDELVKKPEWIRKKKEDEVSYLWDYFIKELHQTGVNRFKDVAKIFNSLNRFDRRILSKSFIEGSESAEENFKSSESNVYRRFFEYNNIVYCFIYTRNLTNEGTLGELTVSCFVANNVFDKKVVGILSIIPISNGKDLIFCSIQEKEWQKIGLDVIEEVRENLGILGDKIAKKKVYESEYPKNI